MNRQDVIDIFNFRFATKEFNGKIVPREDMEMIAETGRLSPSSFGLEPWKFLVVENKELIAEIAKVSWGFQRQVATTSHIILGLTRVGKDTRFDSEFVKNNWLDNKGVDEEFLAGLLPMLGGFQEANMQISEGSDRLLDWNCRQNYIAMGNMMTAAAMIGVDSCPVEGFDKEAVEKILVEKGLLNKEEYEFTYLIAFGYRAEAPNRAKARRTAEDVIEWVK